jgi:hypothetical protein
MANGSPSFLKLFQGFKDQNAMIRAAQNGTEATTAAAIAYRNAIDSGADATAAAALRAETLKNHMLQAASGAGQLSVELDNMDWSDFEAQNARARARNEEYRNRDLYNVTPGKQYESEIDPFAEFRSVVRGITSGNRFGSAPNLANLPLGAMKELNDFTSARREAMRSAEASFLGGSSSNLDKINGIELQIQALLEGLGRNPENIWQIRSLEREIENLRNSVDANTDALNKVTLNPLYTEGRSALRVGYMGAARGLDFTVQGGTPGVDSVPVNIMAQQGERVQVTPAGQVSNDNSRVNNLTVNNYFGGGSSSSRRSRRQLATQGFAQMMAAAS